MNRLNKGLALSVLVLTGLVFIPHADVCLGYGSVQTEAAGSRRADADNPADLVVAAEDEIEAGMSKIEVYEVKGVPDKINRLPDLENKEQWVYTCMNSDGYNEDCLFLLFDGDRLVKIVEK